MASTIKIKRSSIAGKLPNTTNLSTGELALNITDGRLYSSNGTHVFEIGANVASLSVGSGSFTIANGSLTFPTTDGNSGQAIVTNGSGQLSFGDVVTTCNTSIYFATGGETKIPVGYTNTNLIIVTLNGIELTPTYDYTSTDNINIGNIETLVSGDVVVIKEFKGTTNNIRVL